MELTSEARDGTPVAGDDDSSSSSSFATAAVDPGAVDMGTLASGVVVCAKHGADTDLTRAHYISEIHNSMYNRDR